MIAAGTGSSGRANCRPIEFRRPAADRALEQQEVGGDRAELPDRRSLDFESCGKTTKVYEEYCILGYTWL
jgi:hypothetical protein